MIATGQTFSRQTTRASAPTLLRGALFFLALALLGLPLFSQDFAVWEWLREHSGKSWRNLAGQISDFGDWPYLMGAGVLAFLVFRKMNRRTAARVVLLMMVASSIGGLGANSLRLTLGRTRPNAKVEQGWYGLRDEGKWIIVKNQYHAFPSGHTATVFGFFGVLIFRRRWPAWFWLGPGMLMAACRMTIGAHYLSDVYYGAWFGLLAASLVVKWAAARPASQPVVQAA